MVNLILNLNIRVKRVADTKKTEIKLEHKGQAGGRHQNKPTRERPKLLGRFFGGKNMKKEEQFRTINTLENNRIVCIIPSLYKIAKYFKDNFFGKKVVYCTRNQKVSVYFSESNFMHLYGLYYSRGAKNFFLDCLDKKLDVSSLLVKKDGTTFQKLAILNSVTELTSSHVRLTGSGRYLYLEFDYALRTKKQILALTLKDTSKKIVPQSLLDLKKKRDFPKGEAVIKIYAVDFYTGKEWIYYTEEIDLKEK